MLNSIVEYYDQHESYRCGYCRKPDTNFSHGMWAHTMTVGDYQDLIDRGWRRSGRYCYKPTMDVTCCPMYTIRCRSVEFKATKSQKKVLKYFNKFLMGEENSDQAIGDVKRKMSTGSIADNVDENACEGGGEEYIETKKVPQDINISTITTSITALGQNTTVGSSRDLHMDVLNNKTVIELSKSKDIRKGLGPDPSKGPCKKAKHLRRERKLEKLKEKGVDVCVLSSTNKNKEKQLEDFINEMPDEFKNRLQIKLVRTAPPSPEWLNSAKETHDIYVKYQTIIHNDKPMKLTVSKFRDFLVESPLLEEYSDSGPACGYGSFHQQYWLDGKIIAVGVIDILPKCVSSVYFFYDPRYMNLTLGTYGALREISFARHLHSLFPDLKYYYMGFYIHSCRKMRYKGNFYPSDLLCPETYQWFPLKDCISKMEATPYCRLDPDIDNVDNNFPKENDLKYIPVYVQGIVLPYEMYEKKYDTKKERVKEVMQYAQLVGVKAAKSLILVR